MTLTQIIEAASWSAALAIVSLFVAGVVLGYEAGRKHAQRKHRDIRRFYGR